jgi:predicted dithiol-disulfide oxidoreductase (DUF899 family)
LSTRASAGDLDRPVDDHIDQVIAESTCAPAVRRLPGGVTTAARPGGHPGLDAEVRDANRRVPMPTHRVGTREEWLAARTTLLAEEKEHFRRGDELARQRQQLPWVPVSKEYVFDTEHGRRTLAELFDGRSQLLTYHFMFGEGFNLTPTRQGCTGCSFVADHFDAVIPHLQGGRDVTFVCVSIAPLDELLAYREQMGWRFPWVSSAGSDFNFDLGVAFSEEQQANGADYNFAHVAHPPWQREGMSAFAMQDGAVHHTYSSYARGVETLMGTYQFLDVAPLGRNEDDLEFKQAWWRRHDEYGPA